MSDKKGDSVNNMWPVPDEFWKKEDMKYPLLCQSSFSLLYPKYREKYMRDCIPLIKHSLLEYGIVVELDVIEGSVTVKTTKKTWDPFIILKSRDLLKLISRGVPYEQALKVLKDDISCDVIKIKSLVRNKEKFIKRRARLVGPKGATLKALELITECYVLVQGSTVSAIGPYKGLAHVRNVVEDTMRNVHPIYNIKALMIKKDLSSDPALQKENWDRYLPKYSNKMVSKKAPKRNKKKEYQTFPPPQMERKVDKLISSGEYFLKEEEIKKKRLLEKMEKKSEIAIKRQEDRKKCFIPPQEKSYWKKD